MDTVLNQIVEFVSGFDDEQLSDQTVHEVKRRVVDSVGCALGGVDSPPALIAQRVAAQTPLADGATMIGCEGRTSVELAAFANAVAVRYLDYNDASSSAGVGGGHPSDMIAAILAVAEVNDLPGRDVVVGTLLAYEVMGALGRAFPARARGWDQGILTVAGTAAALAKILHLDGTQVGHAVSLALTPNVPLRVTRAGHLSMWKGGATAHAGRNAIFAMSLAQAGMTGPELPFEGRHGLFEQVSGAFALSLPIYPDGQLLVEMTGHKRFPCEYHCQAPVESALRLRERIGSCVTKRIEVETYFEAYSEAGAEPERWRPSTRETADHSLPYLVAIALLDGDLTLRSFDPARFDDAELHALMDLTTVTEKPEFTARYPAEFVTQISVTLDDGEVIRDEVTNPPGHYTRPLSDAEIDAKFAMLASSVANQQACVAARDLLWRLEDVERTSTVMEPLRAIRRPSA